MVGLVGPNGAGKSTLLNLAVGHAHAVRGRIEVLGDGRPAGPAPRDRVGYVAQDTPTYAGLSVADHLRLGAHLNPRWDDALARDRIGRLGLDPTSGRASLSGGQRCAARAHPRAGQAARAADPRRAGGRLDPLARREFLQDLMETVAEQELSVVLSSHLVSDLERTCDFLIVLVDSRVQVAGDIDELLAGHHRLTGPRRDPGTLPGDQHVVTAAIPTGSRRT